MPIGPIGQQAINPIQDVTAETSAPQMESSQPQSVAAQPEQPAASNSAAAIATQLVQDARAAKSSGNDPAITGHLGDLVNAVTSQMGMENLPNEQRQSMVAGLADDPVVKSLIG